MSLGEHPPMPGLDAKCRLAAAALLVALMGMPAAVRAESIEKTFFEFDTLKHKFDQQEKKRIEEGYVLESLKDKSGKKSGTFSFGGANSVEDPYQQFGARTNFRGSTINEIDGPKLNLRLSF
jgi:hypothetical protein